MLTVWRVLLSHCTFTLVPVHYTDIVKWELRSVDRRAAQSVPSIFFKLKKIQLKIISDKANLKENNEQQKRF